NGSRSRRMISARGTSALTARARLMPANDAPTMTSRGPLERLARTGTGRRTEPDPPRFPRAASPAIPADASLRMGRLDGGITPPRPARSLSPSTPSSPSPPRAAAVRRRRLLGSHLHRFRPGLASRVPDLDHEGPGAGGGEVEAEVGILTHRDGRPRREDGLAVERHAHVRHIVRGDRQHVERMSLKARVIRVHDDDLTPV